MDKLKSSVSSKVPAVFAPNFSIGVNFTLKMLKTIAVLPEDYEISIVEAHHSKKKDAPSGTAIAIANLISKLRGYKQTIYGRSGISQRTREEIEVLAVRGGGIPGIHEVIIAGPYDMISIKHVSFSRSAFAQGALYAAGWIMKQTKPGVYSMDDVLGGG
jgi:4-hydroxy-tetrahydrodipicolinate reductase